MSKIDECMDKLSFVILGFFHPGAKKILEELRPYVQLAEKDIEIHNACQNARTAELGTVLAELHYQRRKLIKQILKEQK
jgi:hypothetical protein